MKKAIIVYNTEKKEACVAARELCTWGNKQGIAFEYLDNKTIKTAQKNTDFILSLGGDGTFLQAARLAFGSTIPIYGVNFGRLGFLATGNILEVKQDIKKIVEGKFSLTKRDVIRGKVMRGGKSVKIVHALNDLVVSMTNLSRMTELRVSVNGDLLSTFRSDGIILSTPTGSTAYALSAGGPIIPPDVSCMLLVPICAHTLFARPVVLGGTDKTVIEILPCNSKLSLTQDGQFGFELLPKDTIEAEIETKFKIYTIETDGKSYYDLLRRKLSWGFNGIKGEQQL